MNAAKDSGLAGTTAASRAGGAEAGVAPGDRQDARPGDPPKVGEARTAATRSRRSLIDVRPVEWSLHLPWFNRHQPYVALDLSAWGYEVGGGRSRRRYHVILMAGRLFTDRSWMRSFDFFGRWS